MTKRTPADLEVTRIGELSEVVGRLVAVAKERVLVEATRRFEITVDWKMARSMRGEVGSEVAVLCIDGKTRWRLLRALREEGE